jgi:formylglycine-generating enzyme required for sulfatase activity
MWPGAAHLKVFLSYPSEDRPLAQDISLALTHHGHDVFFDREDLPPGESFHDRIRAGIEGADLVVFLVSPEAIDAGSYTLNEVDIAARAFPRPSGRILPVLVRPTPLDRIPATLKAVTLLQTEGNLTAAVADAVQRIARARGRSRMLMVSAGLAFAAAAALAGYGLLSGESPRQDWTGKDGAPAALVPAGPFTMGDDEESPRCEVHVSAFYLDRYEITVARYAKFLEATGSVHPPEGWEGANPAKSGELPVVGVDWQDADAYCRWAGKRLPTETEWEKAARGSDARRYPWGDASPMLEHANFQNTSPLAYDGGLTPAGTHPAGASPYGIHDLAGNAAEWVADWHAEGFERGDVRDPKGPESGTRRVIRGGGRFDGAERIASAKRYYASPETRGEDIGFRCARSAD